MTEDDATDLRRQARELNERADTQTDQGLRDAHAAVEAAQAELDAARAKRAAEITRAMDEQGWTLKRVAETLGVSFQRVAQLRGRKS